MKIFPKKYKDFPKKIVNIQSQQHKSVFTRPKDIPDIPLKLQKNLETVFQKLHLLTKTQKMQ